MGVVVLIVLSFSLYLDDDRVCFVWLSGRVQLQSCSKSSGAMMIQSDRRYGDGGAEDIGILTAGMIKAHEIVAPSTSLWQQRILHHRVCGVLYRRLH